MNVSNVKKYIKAKYAGTRSSKCTLLICEGDSAQSMTRTSLSSKDVNMSYDYFGSFNIGGVPMNSRCKSNTYIVEGKQHIKRQKQLIENERLTSLSVVLNLDYNKSYQTQEEFDTLSYGCVVACVDQDLDGVGQIFGLLLSHFERFWPNLIKRGYVKQLATPIIRAFPKISNVESFYTDEEYRKWSSSVDESKWVIKYYKGLPTHSDDDARIHMFKNYKNTLYTISYDEKTPQMMNIYYVPDPDLRKKELVTNYINSEQKNNSITCSHHLQTHTKEFQLDNIKRVSINVYDGLNPSRRKVLCALT